MAQAASTYLGEQRRRSTRIDQALPLIVRGVDLLGQPFEERTATQSVSFHGCRYASKHHLPKNTWVTLEIPSGYGQRGPYCARVRVAWIQRPRTLRDLFQVGAEMETGGNIWGVSFPPKDWTAGGDALEMQNKREIKSTVATDQALLLATAQENDASLESYLESAFNALAGASSQTAKPAGEVNISDSSLFDELRSQFHTQSQRAIEEARAVAERLVKDRATEFHAEQKTTAQAFYEKWRVEFEKGQTDAKDQISTELSQQLAAQISRVKQEVHENLSTTWESTIERTQAALMDWERRAERLREESRTASEEVTVQAEQRIDEKLKRQLEALRQELASVQATKPDEERTPAQTSAMTEGMREQLQSEVEQTRAQWIELLESSLDSAAQKLAGRLTETSQQMVQTAEHRLASRVAELQEESGLSTEAARAALEEMKAAIEQEIGQAKTSLTQIQQEAAHFSDYSRQLEAASQDSFNELRQRLESSVATRTSEMERQGAELQGQIMARAENLLGQASQRVVAQTIEELNVKISPQLERAADAVRQLSAREQQAEEILRIHRERLRQVGEQVQREAAARMSEVLSELRGSLDGAGKETLAKWNAEFAANGAQALQHASATLDETVEGKLQTAATQLAERLDSAKSEFAQSAEEHLKSAKGEFAREATAAAADFAQVLQQASSNALEGFSASLDAQAEEGRARAVAATQQLTQSLEAHAETAFDDFQQRISAQTGVSLVQSSQRLAAQTEAALETLQQRGEGKLAEWTEKHKSLGEAAYNNFEGRLRAASDSQLNSCFQQLDDLGRNRIDFLVHTAEEAMRKACFDVFDGMARAVKEKLLGAITESPDSPRPTVLENNPREHRASA